VNSWSGKPTHRQLWWLNGRGLASCDGVTVQLHKPPRIVEGSTVSEVSYLGAQPTKGRIHFDGEFPRGLTDAEAVLIEEKLQRMAQGAQDVWL
jgi:hypothetical protein